MATRGFLTLQQVRGLVADRFGTDRRPVALDRLRGGAKKGVYRLRLDDGTVAVLYVWAPGENYFPPAETVPDDPFTDASGAELFAVAHAALTAAGARVPAVLALEREGRHLPADLALVEDVGSLRLEELMERDPAAAAAPLAELGATLRRLHTTTHPTWGRPTAPAPPDPDATTAPPEATTAAPEAATLAPEAATLAPGGGSTAPGPGARPAEDVVVDRALVHLDAAAGRDARLGAARDRVAAHVAGLRAAVRPRQAYGLVHGELGPDHVFVTPAGEPVIIDIEGLTWFDVEWDHAWLRMRFADAYPALRPVELDPDRLELYRYAQVLSLVEGPLRIADTDFPDRQWMLELAAWNVAKALAPLRP